MNTSSMESGERPLKAEQSAMEFAGLFLVKDSTPPIAQKIDVHT